MSEEILNEPQTGTQISHSPVTGLYDIKPLEIKSTSYAMITYYVLGLIFILTMAYVLRNYFKSKILKVKKTELPPDVTFHNAIHKIKSEASQLDFRTYCEALSDALKNVLSSHAGYKLSPLTPSQLRKYLQRNADTLGQQNQSVEFLKFSEEVHTLASRLEGGEYGDAETVLSLKQAKEELVHDTEKAGEYVLSLIHAKKAEKLKNQQNSKYKNKVVA